ncbi:hypothetical protein [Candidatus Uabimicrobium amorphum]|uniref:PEP-CTERM protein-sorting domain-containing protein n=1 Tax=Uabimicrobium amorphum TaxID=2596890 RepID=A0A5S9IN59_UABAM|nr:hypothetical protein [Candidatus Uabimicrobium amorphum]BBM84597.1 hypothetical protein UABAM_02958 [Candidatus Uabimicrobium amorphum]
MFSRFTFVLLLLLSMSYVSAATISIRATGEVDKVVKTAGLFDLSSVDVGDVVTFEWLLDSADFVGSVTGPGQDITNFLSSANFRIFDNSGDIINVDFVDFFGSRNINGFGSRGILDDQGNPLEGAVLAFINHNDDNTLRLENRVGVTGNTSEFGFGPAEFDNQSFEDMAEFIHNNIPFASFAAVDGGNIDLIQMFSDDGTTVTVTAAIPEPQTYCLLVFFGLIFFSKRKK